MIAIINGSKSLTNEIKEFETSILDIKSEEPKK